MARRSGFPCRRSGSTLKASPRTPAARSPWQCESSAMVRGSPRVRTDSAPTDISGTRWIARTPSPSQTLHHRRRRVRVDLGAFGPVYCARHGRGPVLVGGAHAAFRGAQPDRGPDAVGIRIPVSRVLVSRAPISGVPVRRARRALRGGGQRRISTLTCGCGGTRGTLYGDRAECCRRPPDLPSRGFRAGAVRPWLDRGPARAQQRAVKFSSTTVEATSQWAARSSLIRAAHS